MCGTPVEGAGPSSPLDAAGTTADASPDAPPSARERKVATILFADLVGFTSLNETHDPELVQAVVSRAFDRASDEVARYEGTVEKFAGDAMLALFGVPQVHEDDPERAVRAALEMQSAIGELAEELRSAGRPDLVLRIGIETGEVLVDQARVVSERDRMVTGDPVNTAARLQQSAPPGSVVVGPSTYAATREIVEYEELEPVALKGKAVPVATWRAVAVKARRGGVRAPLGLEAPLIGRDEELALLKETVRRTVSEGRPHLVTVLGSAGVGKSRLVWELEKYLDGLPGTYHWRKGRSLAYGSASYSALADAIKQDARILDDDPRPAVDEKLGDRMLELGLRDEQPLRDALGVLVGSSSAELPRDELHDGWRRYLEAIGTRAPLVLVLEDVHWADEGLLDFVEFLARWAGTPILLVCLARHELLERRPAWGGGIPNAATIVLEPLAAGESVRLVEGLLGGRLPASLTRRITAIAEGNPLFTEELVRMFIDRGVVRSVDGRWDVARPVEEVEVPRSIHAVLAARLDGLPAAEKRVAQDAAVVGRIFWDAVVADLEQQRRRAVVDLLRLLRVKELVVPREPSALAGAREYGFRHVLIRDVAYDSLPKRDRAEKHLQVARWAEAELADRREEFVELLASHYVAALAYEEEFAPSSAGTEELRRQVLDHATRAGRRAASLHEKESTARWLGTARDVAERMGLPAVERARLADEYVTETWGYLPLERALAVARGALEELVPLPRSAERDELAARLRASIGRMEQMAGRVEKGREVLRDGIDELEGAPPTPARARLLARLGWSYWRAGPVDQARPVLERAIAEARASGARDIEGYALHELGVALWLSGESGGVDLLQESFRIAREIGDHALLMRCYINVPDQLEEQGGDWREALRIAHEGLDIARRSVDRASATWLCHNISELLEPLGRLREAAAYSEEAVEWARAFGDSEAVALRSRRLAWLRLLRGERDEARGGYEAARAGISVTEPQGSIWDRIWNALLAWPTDPGRAARELAGPGFRAGGNDVYGAYHLARMALRLADAALLEAAVGAVQAARRRVTRGRPALELAWLEALRDGDDGWRRAQEAAAALEAAGYLLSAADAYADAALLAARAGIDASAPLSAAQRLYTACEAVPVLGPLPETRWIGASRLTHAATDG